MTTPSALRFEHHEEPFGIGEDRPRLSWQVRTDAPGWVQTAYELELGPDAGSLVSYGRVDSAEQLLRPWPAAPAGQPRACRGPGPRLGQRRRGPPNGALSPGWRPDFWTPRTGRRP